jgi:flagellar motor protein MotB
MVSAWDAPSGVSGRTLGQRPKDGRLNQELSQKRADAHGFGDTDPVAPNDTPQGRAAAWC